MLKKFLLCVLCAVSALPLAALKFEAFALRNRNLGDQWTRLAVDEPPILNGRREAATGEPFEISLFFSECALKDEKADVELTFEIIDPKGGKTVATPTPISALKGDVPKIGMALSTVSIRAAFEPSDSQGEFQYVFRATDRNNGAHAEKTVVVRHIGKYRPSDRTFRPEEYNSALMSYYRTPDSTVILPIWRSFLVLAPQLREKQKAGFNPASQLAFFVFVLEDNPQAHEAFLADCRNLAGENKEYAMAVISAVPKLCEAAKQAGFSVGKANPGLFRVDKIVHPVQEDILWSEFFARGTFAPIEKLAAATVSQEKTLTVEEYKKRKNPTDADRSALFRGIVVMAAEWSLVSNASSQRLVFFYLESIVRQNEQKNPALAGKIKGVLASAVRSRKAREAKEKGTQPGGSYGPAPEK